MEVLTQRAGWAGLSRPTTRWHGPSWREARKLVASRWDAVETLAEALLRKGTVSGSEIEEIMVGTIPKLSAARS